MKASFDVFLSHSSKDEQWVNALKKGLEKYGLTVWTSTDEIRPGNLFAEDLEAALEASRAVAIVVSPDAIASGWVKEEYYRALSLTKKREDAVQLVPILLENAELPGFLEGRNWVDFRSGSDFSQKLWKLVWGITGRKPAQVLSVHSPQISSESRSKGRTVEYFLTDKFERTRSRLLRKVRDLIARHGLDDENWAKAVSSQYFLVGLARKLDMLDQQDYENVLNLFLGSFHHRVNDMIVLDERRVLVTPEENEKIMEHMIMEDSRDAYYRNSEKTKAENIDPSLMHYNYLYGLAAGISSTREYPVMQTIHRISIDNLIYGRNKSPLDDYGGWYPYRVPWITARVLISLKTSYYSERVDASSIEKAIDRAVESLISRIYREQYWRSGVGEWVSKWESTALCLEAIDVWGATEDFRQELQSVLTYVISEQHEWLISPPDFSSEESSNKTLAAVILAAVILRLTRSSEVTISGVDADRYMSYMSLCLETISAHPDHQSRQFCTIPQVAFYITDALVDTGE